MKFGVREICNVIFRATATRKIGKKVFYKDEPVLLFDTLKTSTMEGTATTVYAQGGRGNVRLVAWDGERTLTFTMEDALISAEGLAILASAELLDAETTKPIYQHVYETRIISTSAGDTYGETSITLATKYTPAANFGSGNPIIKAVDGTETYAAYVLVKDANGEYGEPLLASVGAGNTITIAKTSESGDYEIDTDSWPANGADILIDYYTAHSSDAKQINITPEMFGGNFYIEADTLFRNEAGVDYPAEFIIPNGKVQSNFTFNMSSTGDPSTFTFTVDALRGELKTDHTKVLAAIQIIEKDQSVAGDVDYGEFRATTVATEVSD